MFIQIHMLQSVPPGNLNRDDSGQPKKCIFGGVTRSRISSQCLKRSIRESSFFKDAFHESIANRTRLLPKLVADELLRIAAISSDEADGVKTGLRDLFGTASKKQSSADDSEPASSSDLQDNDKTRQVVFFPPLFVTSLAELLRDLKARESKAWKRFIGKEKKAKNKDDADRVLEKTWQRAREAREALSVDVALFGRMTTSELLGNVDATVQVAHAISTHESLIESDYFTAVDELDRSGAGFVSDADARTFFSTAVLYKYLNIDVAQLAERLGDAGRSHASHAPAVFIQAAALSGPTGKQNAFAAHSVPELILVELSEKRQPISYANAFLKPVEGKDLMRESAEALSDYCGSVAAAFAPADTKRFLLVAGTAKDVTFDLPAQKVGTLPELVRAVEEAVTLQPA